LEEEEEEERKFLGIPNRHLLFLRSYSIIIFCVQLVNKSIKKQKFHQIKEKMNEQTNKQSSKPKKRITLQQGFYHMLHINKQ
jgi:hypothetical protein